MERMSSEVLSWSCGGRVSGWLVGRQEGLLYHVPLASLKMLICY